MKRANGLLVMWAAVALGACGGGDEGTSSGGSSSTGATTSTETAAPTGPGQTPPAAAPIEAMACAGEEHTCVLKADGNVFCWGQNLEGQLADGTRQQRWAPVPVVGVTGARQIACGQDHTCAVRTGGRVTCWGSNDHGQLGAGNTEIQLQPVEVSGLTDAAEVQLGYDFSCARRADGSVACWGSGEDGRLGPGVSGDQASPQAVQGLAGVTALALGTSYACAIAGGTLSCWGGNGFGQLGRGQGGSSAGIAPVAGLTGVTAVDLGNGHSCAAHAGGVSCWGYDSYGQLGNGEGPPDRSPTPVPVQGIAGPVTALALGSEMACARGADGKVLCWGYGGRLGIDDSDNRHIATEVPGLTDVRQLTVGFQHACALKNDGALFCWGTGGNGQLGGSRASRVPVSVLPNVAQLTAAASTLPTFAPGQAEGAPVPRLAVARDFVCGVVPDGRVRCFGQSGSGGLGNGSLRAIPSSTESYVHGITDARQVDAWWEAACAVRASGEVACWGKLPVAWDNRTLATNGLPMPLPGITDAEEVAIGQTMICVRHRTGAVSCMGQNASGQLGNGTNASSDTFVPVQGLTDAVQLSAGYATMCARRQGGTISCWGYNGYGELGIGSTANANVPTEVPGIRDAVDVSVDYYHVCAVHNGGRVSCWGRNNYAQLGIGRADETGSNRPVEVSGIRDAARVDAYQSQTCIVRTSGEAACWGSNSWGGAGLGDDQPTVERIDTPTAVARERNADVTALGPYVTYAPGMNFGCGLHRSGGVSCSGITPIQPAGFFGGGARSRAPIVATGFRLAETP
jgi:alpha-tubulin suppressor-like RCC1 family protein